MIENIKCRIDNNEDEIVYDRGIFDGFYVRIKDSDELMPLWQVLCDLLYINSDANTIIIGEKTVKGIIVEKAD